MTDRRELNGLMRELIEITDDGRDTVDNSVFNDRAREIVSEIAQYAESRKMYQENKEQSENFFPDGTTAHQILITILYKVVDAPTTVHRDASVLMFMPVLKKALDDPDGIYRRGESQ